MGRRILPLSFLFIVVMLTGLALAVEGAPPMDTELAEESALWISHGPRGGRALALEASPAFAADGVAFSGEWLSSLRFTESGMGIVRSADWGRNWNISDAGTTEVLYASAVHDLSFSPSFATDQTVFAATWGGLFKSVDGGLSWSWLEAAYSGPPGAYSSIAVAPDYAASSQVLAGDTGGLLRSDDGGASWLRLDDVGAAADIAYAPPTAAGITVFAADGAALFRSPDAAVSWSHVLTAPVTSLAVSPAFATDQTVYAAGGARLYLSQDGGHTWSDEAVAAEVTSIHALAISPQFAADQTLFAGTAEGLYWSRDGGASWQAIAAYEGLAIRALAISPQWPQHAVLLVGTDEGVSRMLTADTAAGVVREQAAGFAPLAASPLDWSAAANLLLTATSNHGLYGSDDGGKRWQAMGLQAAGSYYSFSDVAISPAFEQDRTLFAAYLSGTGIGGSVYRSRDGGETWQNVYSTDYVGDLAFSPQYASDQTIFATSGDHALVRSTNGGDDWEEVGTWPGGGANGIALYIALPPNYPDDSSLFVGGSRGFWRLPPGESVWQPSLSGLSNQHTVVSLAISPDFENDNTLLAVAHSAAPGGSLYGVFRSLDGGVNWHPTNAGTGTAALFDVSFSPDYAQDRTAYLTTAAGELYQSLDGGENWLSLGSPPGAPQLFDVIVREDGSVFVGSQAGVWQYVAEPFYSHLPLFYGRALPD